MLTEKRCTFTMAAVIIQEPGKQTPLQLGDKLSVAKNLTVPTTCGGNELQRNSWGEIMFVSSTQKLSTSQDKNKFEAAKS